LNRIKEYNIMIRLRMKKGDYDEEEGEDGEKEN
jgi:hypothetical protein